VSSRTVVLLVAVILLAPSALAASRTCTRLIDPPRIDQSIRLCADNFYSDGITIIADNVVLDCGTAVLKGKFKSTGITIQDRKHVTIKNCQIANYDTGIIIKNSRDITIIGSSLIRNLIGIKLIDSSKVTVEQSMDISITRPVHAINSKGNVFQYVNKKLEGDQCRLNQCNTPSGIAAHERSLAKAEAPKNTLRRLLSDNLRAWIA